MDALVQAQGYLSAAKFPPFLRRLGGMFSFARHSFKEDQRNYRHQVLVGSFFQ
jgi:hypothetical protein